MADMTCEIFALESAELALGVADGHTRAAAVAHLEGCPRCRARLAELGGVADRLFALTPPAEPPAGFEERVMAALTPARLAPRRPRALRVAAAVAAVVAVGAGGWLAGASRAHPPAGAHPVAARLVSAGGARVGEVVLVGGPHPWMSVAVDGAFGDQKVLCQLRESGGATVTVGTFALWNGHGYWAAPVQPAAAGPGVVTLEDAAGATIATASLPGGGGAAATG